MQGGLDALLSAVVEATEPVDWSKLPSMQRHNPLPHGILQTIHLVLADWGRLAKTRGTPSPRPGGGRRARSTTRVVETPLSGEGGKAKVTPEGTRRRRRLAKLLLEQALRALRLSLVVVGGSLEDEDKMSPVTGGDLSTDLDGGGGHEAAHEMPRNEERIMGVMDPGAARIGTGAGKRPARSVNANAHVGGVSVDCRGHIVLPSSGRVHDESVGHQGKGHQRGSLDRSEEDAFWEGEGDRSSSTDEEQRLVVGAWLLAKEACKCLSAMVTAFPLPASMQPHDGRTRATQMFSAEGTQTRGPGGPASRTSLAEGSTERKAGSMSASGMEETTRKHDEVDEADGTDVAAAAPVGVGSELCLLDAEDVKSIGEALVESLLSLKHMGCLASVQVRIAKPPVRSQLDGALRLGPGPYRSNFSSAVFECTSRVLTLLGACLPLISCCYCFPALASFSPLIPSLPLP